jgi:hypothetical protein
MIMKFYANTKLCVHQGNPHNKTNKKGKEIKLDKTLLQEVNSINQVLSKSKYGSNSCRHCGRVIGIGYSLVYSRLSEAFSCFFPGACTIKLFTAVTYGFS